MKNRKKSKKAIHPREKKMLFKISSLEDEDGTGFIVITGVDEDELKAASKRSNSRGRTSRRPRRSVRHRSKSRRSVSKYK